MQPIVTSLGRQGRLVIPAEARRELALEPGDELIVRVEDGVLLVEPRATALRRVQAEVRNWVPQDRSLADELIAERREEAVGDA